MRIFLQGRFLMIHASQDDRDRLTGLMQRTLPNVRISAMPLPLCPELWLYLVDPTTLQYPLTTDHIEAVLRNTPYWSFCWAGGQALAHYILQHPDQLAGQSVLDFGSGSGVVAMAAAKAGAWVTACDCDPDARIAIHANAALNGVTVDVTAYPKPPFDRVIAADVLYDRDNAHFLADFLTWADAVWVADSRAPVFEVAPYQPMAQIASMTWPAGGDERGTQIITLYRAQGRRLGR